MARFSLVIPTYNESHNIRAVIRRATLALQNVLDNFEIIVVDDDSPDGTWKVAEELARHNPHVRMIRRRGEKGLATAVVHGWEAAQVDILGVMDGDLQHPPETLPALLHVMMTTPSDVAIASRNVTDGGVSQWSLLRRSTHYARWVPLVEEQLPGEAASVGKPRTT